MDEAEKTQPSWAYLQTITGDGIFLGLVALAFAYCISMVIYRLYISNLAGFPGPKLAAVTSWYEFYYDVVKHGKYIFEIERMHAKYGPIVRINPHELSVHDPEFYNELYVSGSVRRTENYSHFVKGIDFDGSHFLTTTHDLHRRRRKPLEPYFSRLGVIKLQPILADLTRKLTCRLEALKGSKTVIRLDHAYFAFSGDVIGRICCDDIPEFLEDQDFAPHWFELIHGVIHSIPLFIGFPFLIQIVGIIPERIVSWAYPHVKALNDFKTLTNKHISMAKQENPASRSKAIEITGRTSLFRHILASDMPESELSSERLSKEAQVLLGAGSVSTARTLDFISYYILANKKSLATLQEELGPIMSGYPENVPSWPELEKLQYLQALIKEGLRLSYGVMHRLPRVSPDVPLTYKQWIIPAGAPVGMSAYLMHTDPVIYPKPFEFNPERWLGDIDPLMNRNFVPFSKGSRNCLGMNLAYAEINLVLAVIFRPGGPVFDLFETDESDIIQAHDYMIPLPKLESKGVRVLIH